MDLNDLLSDIARGNIIKPSNLLSFLCAETREERCRVNTKLAEAYLKAGNYHQAQIFIQRAWLLSQFDEKLLPLYVDINSAADEIEAIKEAYKRVGMKKASQQNVGEALKYFMSSIYSYAQHKHIDKYEYDFEILEGIRRLAGPDRFEPVFKSGDFNSRKVHIAYLVFGILHDSSVMAKINRIFAEYHDKSRFDIAFFIPEEKKRVSRWKQAVANLDAIKSYGCEVFLAPNIHCEGERLREVAQKIYEFQPDALITNALLADLGHYYIASLTPAPVTIGFSQGPPPQFVSQDIDWSISWTKHPLIDCPCNCSLVDLEIELPKQNAIKFYTKQQLNIPEDGFILMSGGRYPKFQKPEFWKAIFDIMCLYHDVYYVVIGVREDELLSLEGLLTADLKTRLRFIGWRQDYLEILGLADIVIDTFPSGGGVFIMEAMAIGIPVVSFKNNYLRLFDQTDWSPAEEFVNIPDLIVERGNFEQFKILLSKLIDNQEYRMKLAQFCKEQIHLTKGNPERMVRKCESIYMKVFGKKLQHNISNKNQLSGLDEIGNIDLKSNLRKIPHKIKEKLIRYAKLF